MRKYDIPLLSGRYYLLSNWAVGEERLFREDDNYAYFLKKYFRHTVSICDTLSFGLMPDHFHFLVKIRSSTDCLSHFDDTKPYPFEPGKDRLSDFIMERFSNCCNAYAKGYNKVYNRKGSLFIDCMKRVEVKTRPELTELINYIHYNPVLHGLCKGAEDWNWTSLQQWRARRGGRIRIEPGICPCKSEKEFRKMRQQFLEYVKLYEL